MRTGVLLSATIAVTVPIFRTPAQCPGWVYGPDQGIPGTNDVVQASVWWDADGDGPEPGVLVIGGAFEYAGSVRANHVAAWNGDRWVALGKGVDGEVRALAVHNGELFAGGTFAHAGGAPARNIARFDGFAWRPLPGLEGRPIENVTAMAATPVGVVIAHAPDSPSGLHNSNSTVTLCFEDAAADLAVPPTVFAVKSLLFANDRIYAVNNGVMEYVQFNWRRVGGAVSGTAYSLTIHNSRLVLGGSFHSIGGQEAHDLAEFDGAAWRPIGNGTNPAANGQVRAVCSHGGRLYAAGFLAQSFGSPGNGVIQWDGTTWLPVGEGVNQEVLTLSPMGDRLFAGGRFLSAGDPPIGRRGTDHAAAWDGQDWAPMGRGLGGNGTVVRAVAEYNGELILGGTFRNGFDVGADNIARWDGQVWRPLGSGTNGDVHALRVFNGELIVGGGFSSAGGAPANRIAAWNGSAWRPLATDAPVHNAAVFALGEFRGELIAAGTFDRLGGTSANAIAGWNGAAWRAFGSGLRHMLGGTTTPGPCSSLCTLNDLLYVGGGFDTIGEFVTYGLGYWDGENWEPLGSVGGVAALTGFRGVLHGGGGFSTPAGVPALNVAAWPIAELPRPLGAGLNGHVLALGVHNDRLWAGGKFTASASAAMSRVARWDGQAWTPLAGGVDDEVLAIGTFRDEVIIAGKFRSADGRPSSYWARWSDAGPCPCPADFDGDHEVIVSDLWAFLTAFFGNQPGADVNNSGSVTVQDVFDFLAFYLTGC